MSVYYKLKVHTVHHTVAVTEFVPHRVEQNIELVARSLNTKIARCP